jgi:predicted RNase H-like HicB family nuclease
MQFNIVIEQDEDNRYVVECLDLPGCLSEGESIEEAMENISEAIIGCLESRLKTLLVENRPWVGMPTEGKVAMQMDLNGALRYA